MKSIIALGVGLVVALAPGGTAFAAPVDNATGKSTTAWGNCSHSSAGGVNDPRLPKRDGMHGKGNGGWVQVAKGDQPCVAVPEVVKQDPVLDPPAATDPSTDGHDYEASDGDRIT